MRELNRLGVTGVIDAGGGFQNYPDDYAVIEELHARRRADRPHRLQPVHPEAEGRSWTTSRAGPSMVEPGEGDDYLPHERRRRDAGLLGGRLRGLPSSRGPTCRPSMEGELERGRPAAGREPLAVPPARHLRRDDQPRRSTCSRRSTGTCRSTACTGSSTTPRRSPSATSTASRRWAAASPSSTAWPTRASTSSSATAPRRPSARRRSGGCWRWACRSAPAPTPPASRATIRGCRCPGWSPGKTVGGTAALSGSQPPRPRDGAAAVDRGQHLVLQRGGQEGPDQGGPARRSRGARPTTTSRCPRRRSRTSRRC